MNTALTGKAYFLNKKTLFNALKSSEKGLSEVEVSARIKTYGPNKLSEKEKVSPLGIFASQFKNLLTLILLAAAGLTFVVYFLGEQERSDLVEGSLILVIVFMIAILGFIQEYRAEKAIEALKKLLAFKAKVLRDGKEKEIDTVNLVPGDIVILEEGEKVPADIRLLSVSNLQTNEAALTGESTPVTKIAEDIKTSKEGDLQIADQKNMVFSGTIITIGRGLGVVIETGDQTQIGKIASFVAETKEEDTPIQKRLDHLGKILGIGTLAMSAFVFVFIVFFAAELAHLSTIQRLLHSFIAAVALAVAAIPEGLPAVVTISLAFGTQRMLKRNALVRKLTSMETLGSVDVICADKTGTLSKGEMTVREIYFNDHLYNITGEGYSREGKFFERGQQIDPKIIQPILSAGLVCNNAAFEDGKVLGDPTEAALLISASKANVASKSKRLSEIPFTSERKMMSVVVKENSPIMYSKGAPEIILSKCSKIFKNGKVSTLTEAEEEKILEHNSYMAEKALRVLAFAYREVDSASKIDENAEKGLIFIGLQGMIDPPREGVRELIHQCSLSGIRTVMITGDHLLTAKAVSTEIGILGEAITGADLEKMSDEQFDKRVENINIYARVNPEHKFKIVSALKKNGHLVAMTGDGVNDAPALKKADIGVAMGITGTDVAKEASDMVLLDDHFASIVGAIEEGRGIFDNIRKFVDYLLSCNVGEVLVVFISLMIFKDVPLTAIMLLWINVVTDGLPAIALGLDPAEKGILKHSPKKFQGEILNSKVWIEIIVFSIAITVSTVSIFAINLPEGINEARAAAFMAIIIFELIRLVNIRADYKISWARNIWLPISILSSLLLQIGVVYIPFFANLFEVSPIDMNDWLFIIIVSAILFTLFRFVDSFLSRSDQSNVSGIRPITKEATV